MHAAERYIYAAYGLTWVVLIVFTVATVRRVRRAQRAARAVALRETSYEHGAGRRVGHGDRGRGDPRERSPISCTAGSARTSCISSPPRSSWREATAAYDVPVRLGGQVVPGSVVWNAEAVDLRFAISDGAKTVPVHSSGAPPQMFRDGIGVVVEGRYHRAGVFESTSVMVKHSNEYRAPKPGRSRPRCTRA